MKRALQGLLVLSLAVVMALPATAAEEKKKKKKKKGRKAPAAVRVPKGIELSADQKKKVAAINKELAPKLIEINKKFQTVITPEQRKARGAAQKEARAAGKKGKALREAVNAALKISPEQKKQLAELNKARQEILKVAQAKLREILTDEQKAKLPKPKKGKKKKKKKDA